MSSNHSNPGKDPTDGDGSVSSAEPGGAGNVPPEQIRAATEAWESLFRAQVSVMRLLQADAAFSELTMREYDVLFNLSKCPTGWLRLNDLNGSLLMSQPSLSRMVDRLEARGLLQRRQAPEDHRGVLIGLTDTGSELQKKIGREHVRSIGRTVGGALSAGELEQLLALTSKLRAKLGSAQHTARADEQSPNDDAPGADGGAPVSAIR